MTVLHRCIALHCVQMSSDIKLQAEGGEVGALMQMGRLYYAGQRGIPRDAGRALDYFQQAAEQGVPEAEFNIGVMESRGEGTRALRGCVKQLFYASWPAARCQIHYRSEW